MEVTEKKITVKELAAGYVDDGEGGVFAYNGKLVVRPPYQREFVYSDKQRDAVIDTITKKLPLNVMYWAENADGTYEVLDGQQRTISICQFIKGDFSHGGSFYHNLADGETKDAIDNYQLFIYVVKGTEEEKLAWFRIINVAGEELTNQELLNATYYGQWLSDAKKFFSKRDCVAKKISDGFVKGNPIRQEYLETALKWVADRDSLKDEQEYMSIHHHDSDAEDMIKYFKAVIDWAKRLFPDADKRYTLGLAWGSLYNKHKGKFYEAEALKTDLEALGKDPDVTKIGGIIPYLLSDRGKKDEKLLSIRAFDDREKMRKYEEQAHKCPCCGKEFPFEEMQGDHIVPWSKGGHTVYENLQMLCRECNGEKSDK